MKRIIPLLLLTVMFSFACSQPEESENSTTTNSENTVEVQQKDSAEKQQTDAQTENQIKRVKPEKKGKVVARVNGVPIYEDEINGKSLNSAITDEILYQEGLKRGLDEKYEDRVMEYQMSLVVRDMKSRILGDLPPTKEVSNEEIEEYYEANKDKYMNIKMEEINFSDKEKSEEIKKMVGDGKDFKEIESQYPESDVKFNDLGYNKKLMRYFDTKEVGAVTEVIEKGDGTYSVLKIVEIKEIPTHQVRNSIKHSLEARAKAQAYNDFAEKIKEESSVNIEIINESN
ncbi:MAG: hypothetical protein RIG61_03700 [Deltaproteobacteria bacterium]